ncbi:hypothetical protein SLEP1_g9002 [Rubroshorea leprosula]|uniref:Uncharacterized protein n=1 Tax=Rubroshorea leprosula TaxID=152421 RepID=A0AAV5I3L9_9ROSI|nr:hypothetical protein SLEP1_g9002 [Rubroshorea leprosula]
MGGKIPVKNPHGIPVPMTHGDGDGEGVPDPASPVDIPTHGRPRPLVLIRETARGIKA